MKQWMKNTLAVFGATVAGLALTVSTAMIAFPAISEIAGLAVAQSSTNWNSVIDASKGDAQTQGILGTSLYLFNGLTFDRVRGDTTNGMDVDVTRISGSITPSDAYANPTTANQVWSLGGVFNGTTWDRIRSASGDSLATTGVLAAGNMLWTGTQWDRTRPAVTDNQAATGMPASGNMAFDGSTWDRVTGISNTNNTATTSQGVRYNTQLSTWSITDTDVGATVPSASRAAGGGTVRHVATSISVCVAAAATAQPAIQVNLRDGATGAGTIIRSWALAAPVNDSACVDLSGLNITGTANTAMTIEFAAAMVANTIGTVNLSGYSTP